MTIPQREPLSWNLRSIPRALRAVSFVAIALLSLTTACTDESDADEPKRAVKGKPSQPYIVTDAAMERMLTCLAELRDEYLRQLRAANPEGPPPQPALGPGISLLVKDGSAITAAHGFARREDFEQALAHAQHALVVLIVGPQRGLGGDGLRHELRTTIQELEQRLAMLQRDQSLAEDEREHRIRECETAIAAAKDRVEASLDVAGAMESMSEAIPRETLDSVAKHRDRFAALLKP